MTTSTDQPDPDEPIDAREQMRHARDLLKPRVIDGEVCAPHEDDVRRATAHAVLAVAAVLDTPIPGEDEVRLLRGVSGLTLAPTAIPATMPARPPAMSQRKDKAR